MEQHSFYNQLVGSFSSSLSFPAKFSWAQQLLDVLWRQSRWCLSDNAQLALELQAIKHFCDFKFYLHLFYSFKFYLFYLTLPSVPLAQNVFLYFVKLSTQKPCLTNKLTDEKLLMIILCSCGHSIYIQRRRWNIGKLILYKLISLCWLAAA